MYFKTLEARVRPSLKVDWTSVLTPFCVRVHVTTGMRKGKDGGKDEESSVEDELFARLCIHWTLEVWPLGAQESLLVFE